MSRQAVQWVKALQASRALWMPRSHWRAMRVVAQFYHEDLGCAFATLQTLADEATISPRHLRRTITELDELGLVKRNAAQRSRDKSDTSNEYELPAYRLVNADAAIRSRIFSVARERIGQQRRLELPELDEEKLSPWMQFMACMRVMNFDRRDKDGCPAPSGHDDKGGCSIVPVDRARKCPGDGDALSRGGRTPRPPVDLTKYFNDEVDPPYAPPYSGANVEISERRPSEGNSSSGLAAFPEHRSARMRCRLDEEDTALREEVTRVMRACGVCPERAVRKVRRAITEALWLESDRSGATITDVGNLARERWQEYQAAGSLLLAPMGLTRFFVQGEWLRPGTWRYDRER